MDLEVVSTMSFVYELMQVMKENLIRQQVGDWIFKIIKDHWKKTLKHPLHAACTLIFINCYFDFISFSYTILNLHNFIIAYFLNPRFQYRPRVGSDLDLIQEFHDVFAKLDPNVELISQFGNEVNKKLLFYSI